MPVVASQNPLVRPAARASSSRWRWGSARCTASPATIAAASAATVARPHRRTSTVRRPAWPDAPSATAWIVSCTKVTSAWFALADNPVTSAWSRVFRGINVRWNVSGAFIAAKRIPA